MVDSGKEEPMATHADHYHTNFAYGRAAYSKGAVYLNQIRYIIGEEAFRSGMLRYHDEWKLKHPTDLDFIRLMEKESGMILDWFHEYFVHTTKTIDYGIALKSASPSMIMTTHMETIIMVTTTMMLPMTYLAEMGLIRMPMSGPMPRTSSAASLVRR